MKMIKSALIIAAAAIITTLSAGCSDDKGNNNTKGPTKNSFTYDDAVKAYDSFHEHLFSTSRNVYLRDTQSTNIAVGWTQAMMFDMILNAYKLTEDDKYLDLMEKHYKGCNTTSTFKFDWYNYQFWDLYDDMMWWVGSFARAHLLIKDIDGYEDLSKEFLKVSEEGFKRVWYGKPVSEGGDPLDAKGSYGGDTGGGMYWDWKFGRTGKMACITYPTVIAAMELYEATGKADYLSKAKDVYSWAAKNLFNTTTGAVADSKHDGNADAHWSMTVYNQATCIGSAAMLYLETNDQTYLNHAKAAMDYVVKNKSNAYNALIAEGSTDVNNMTDEKGIYNAILAQYLPILIEDCGQDQYIQFIENSINLGWRNRDPKRNLTDKLLTRVPSSTGPISSYSSSGVPALMLTFPGVKDRK